MLDAYIAAIHAAHQPGASAQAKLDVAVAIGGDLVDGARVRAQANLARAADVLAHASEVIGHGGAQTLLVTVSNLLRNLGQHLDAGGDFRGAFMGKVATVPAIPLAEAISALIQAQGELELSHKLAQAVPATPLVGDLLELALGADAEGADWPNVALQLATRVACAGNLDGAHAVLRYAEMTLGYAGRKQREVER